MTQQTITIEGADELLAALAQFGSRVQKRVVKESNKIGLALRTNIIREMQQGPTRTGAVYERGGRTSVRSAPGEPPKSDGGDLVGGVVFYRSSQNQFTLKNFVSYGAMLEWGTHKIAPRPLWEPEVRKIQPLYLQQLQAILDRALNEG